MKHPVFSARLGASDDDFFTENVISILFSCFAASPILHFFSFPFQLCPISK
jgi:hypothetical protein